MSDRIVAELANRLAIVDVAVAYSTAVDARDWAALAGLFTDDAVWVHEAGGERVVGGAAIAARISAGVARLDLTQHLVGNHVVTVDGDEAVHSSYFQAQHVRVGLPDGEHFLSGGRYDDHLRRTSEGWLLTQRVLRRLWRQGNRGVFE
jgi:ketosteroid isomerase-like protein